MLLCHATSEPIENPHDANYRSTPSARARRSKLRHLVHGQLVLGFLEASVVRVQPLFHKGLHCRPSIAHSLGKTISKLSSYKAGAPISLEPIARTEVEAH